MNGRIEFAKTFFQSLTKETIPSHVQVGIAAPFPYLPEVTQLLHKSGILTGAQDVSQFDEDGAFTGEVSANILRDVGVQFTLVGHSERRQYFSENNMLLNKKIQNAYQANVQPVFCVGEDLASRQKKQEKQWVTEQLTVLDAFTQSGKPIIVAYEPVWAIGTGKIATPEQIEEMHKHIYSHLLSKMANADTIRVLYGGSVNAENASTIFSLSNVDGALIGGASLKVDDFTQIIKVTEN